MSDHNPSSTSADDAEALRRRVAELEAQVAEARRERDIFRHIVQHAPAFISRLTPDGRVVYMNERSEQITGYRAEDVVGRNLLPLLYPGDLMRAVEEYLQIAATGGDVRDYELTMQSGHGDLRTLAWNSFHRFGEDGQLEEVVNFGVDVTERKQAEAEHRALQEQIIAVQAATLAQLSTPLVPISDQVVAMPLIGAIDEARAQQILETLLGGIADARARVAILDITGVATVDAQVADAIVRAARAVRLLGAEVVLTGIRAEVAQALVGLGTDLSGIETRSTLQSGISYALGRGRKPK